MPDIPVYHSQALPPDTSRLPPANPSIVGGGEILQGMQNLQHSMLRLFEVQQQQAQAEQITEAAKIHTSVVDQLNAKMQELTLGQEERVQSGQPIENPHLLSQRFNSFAKDLHGQAVEASGKLSPAAQKYVATHLQTTVNGAIAKYTEATNNQWQAWNYAEAISTANTLAEQATLEPARMKDLAAALMGYQAVGTLDKAEVRNFLEGTKKRINYNEGIQFVEANAMEYLKARERNEYPPGFLHWKYGVDELNSFRDIAASALSRKNTEQEKKDKQDEKRISDAQDDAQSLFLQKSVLRDENGEFVYSNRQMLDELSTKESVAILGRHYPSLVERFTKLEHHDRTAKDTDRPQFLKLLKRVYSGAFADENRLINEAADHTSVDDLQKLLSAFHSVRQEKNTLAQSNFRAAADLMEKSLTVPANSALDGFPFQQAYARGLGELTLKWEQLRERSIKERNPQLLLDFDVFTESKTITQREFKPLIRSIIQIVKPRLDALPYKSIDALKAARQQEKITEREYTNYVLDFERMQALQDAQRYHEEALGNLKPLGE